MVTMIIPTIILLCAVPADSRDGNDRRRVHVPQMCTHYTRTVYRNNIIQQLEQIDFLNYYQKVGVQIVFDVSSDDVCIIILHFLCRIVNSIIMLGQSC